MKPTAKAGDFPETSGSQTESEWLVEIQVNAWEPALPGNTRIVTFEEVLARDLAEALTVGFAQFTARCHYEPVLRRQMFASGITAYNCFAAGAVTVND